MSTLPLGETVAYLIVVGFSTGFGRGSGVRLGVEGLVAGVGWRAERVAPAGASAISFTSLEVNESVILEPRD